MQTSLLHHLRRVWPSQVQREVLGHVVRQQQARVTEEWRGPEPIVSLPETTVRPSRSVSNSNLTRIREHAVWHPVSWTKHGRRVQTTVEREVPEKGKQIISTAIVSQESNKRTAMKICDWWRGRGRWKKGMPGDEV